MIEYLIIKLIKYTDKKKFEPQNISQHHLRTIGAFFPCQEVREG